MFLLLCIVLNKNQIKFWRIFKKTTLHQYFYLSVNLLVDRFGSPTRQFVTYFLALRYFFTCRFRPLNEKLVQKNGNG